MKLILKLQQRNELKIQNYIFQFHDIFDYFRCHLFVCMDILDPYESIKSNNSGFISGISDSLGQTYESANRQKSGCP